jgi:hypothetical protein
VVWEQLQALGLALAGALALAEVLDSAVVPVEISTAMEMALVVVLAMGDFSQEVKSKPCRTSMTAWLIT